MFTSSIVTNQNLFKKMRRIKFSGDFGIQTDYIILARTPNLIIIIIE